MDRESLGRVRQILADIFNVGLERLEADSSPDTIENWDSVNHINMVIALEQEFGVEFAPEEIERLLTFHAICELINSKLPSSRVRNDNSL
jgi:acyl carrier protein